MNEYMKERKIEKNKFFLLFALMISGNLSLETGINFHGNRELNFLSLISKLKWLRADAQFFK